MDKHLLEEVRDRALAIADWHSDPEDGIVTVLTAAAILFSRMSPEVRAVSIAGMVRSLTNTDWDEWASCNVFKAGQGRPAN